MALLMLPRVVLTHLKAGFRAALRPDPVMIGWWTQPALPTPVKQCRPSLTTVLAGWKLRCAKVAISARRKPFTRRNFKRIGLPSGVVSTAATIIWHLFAMTDDRSFTLRQIDQARGDLYAIHDDLDFIKLQLAQLPTRNEVWRAAMLGMLGGAVAAVTLIETFARSCS